MAAREPQTVIQSPLGRLGIHMAPHGVAGIDLLPPGVVVGHGPAAGPVVEVVAALERYFRDPRIPFDVPLSLSGTAFQQQVWALLRLIPVGRTITYASLAQQLTTSARAVGQACRANPILIIVPCHRVVASRGLGGYLGGCQDWLGAKRWLLQHEARSIEPSEGGCR